MTCHICDGRGYVTRYGIDDGAVTVPCYWCDGIREEPPKVRTGLCDPCPDGVYEDYGAGNDW